MATAIATTAKTALTMIPALNGELCTSRDISVISATVIR